MMKFFFYMKNYLVLKHESNKNSFVQVKGPFLSPEYKIGKSREILCNNTLFGVTRNVTIFDNPH